MRGKRNYTDSGFTLPELLTAMQAGLLAVLFGWMFYTIALQWSERNRVKGEELLHRAGREYQLHTLSEYYSTEINKIDNTDEKYILRKGREERVIPEEGETMELPETISSRSAGDFMKGVVIYRTVNNKRRVFYRYRGARITENEFNNL